MKNPRKGFTLIEVLVAMMILSGAMVALSQSWSGSLFAFRKSSKVNTAVSLLKKKATELEIKYKTNSFSEIPEQEAGDFGSDFSEFTWTAQTQELEFPDLSALLISEDGGANEMILMVVKQMTDFFSKSIKELRVVVVWDSNGKKLNYSVTTYLVNNATSGSLGIGGAGGAGTATELPPGSAP